MTTELIFYTQIVSIVAFIAAVFWLYRLLVTQKDATIEALRERIALQQDRLATDDPDVLKASSRNNLNTYGVGIIICGWMQLRR